MILLDNAPRSQFDRTRDFGSGTAGWAPLVTLDGNTWGKFLNLSREVTWFLVAGDQYVLPIAEFTTPFTKERLKEHDFQTAAQILGIEVALIKAVAMIESRSGFLANGKPAILFEGHKFSGHTKRKYDRSHPTLSHVGRKPSYYKYGIAEYSILS